MLFTDLFIIKNGLASSNIVLEDKSNDIFSLPYIRPTSRFDSLIAWYCDPDTVPDKYIHPAWTLMISTDWEWSHSYSYVVPFKFVANSNVAVLIPKQEMTLEEKLYYALCITANRYKFCYGRKPKANKLGNIILPSRDEIPKRVYNDHINDYKSLTNITAPKNITLNTKLRKTFRYDKIFNITKWQRLTLSDQFQWDIPYISSSEFNNWVDNHIDNGYTDYNCLSFACYWSIWNVFYQKWKVRISDNCNVFYLKERELNSYIALFLSTILEKEKYRFSYWMTAKSQRLKSFIIKLPVDKDWNPDRQFMEDYIKSLPYSSSL